MINMTLINIDQEKCIRCALCSKVCPSSYITMEDNVPEATGQICISCGHCVAVCPTAAIDNQNAPLVNQVPLETFPVFDAHTAETFLRSRRSIRQYKSTAVPKEKILQLLNIARFAPTGGNTQGVGYKVINKAETLHKITTATVDWMKEKIALGSPLAPYFTSRVEHYRKTSGDIILQNAPCLIVAMAPQSFLPRGRDNTHFSLAYAELYAPAIGLGTCWAGFFEACAADGYPDLLDLLKLPPNMVVTGALMAGYPKYTYKRLVDRNPSQVTWD
ncbi:MAG: nitroreductase [Firmicutes bacterium]|nr:nitroreductase [Bacillota bacterium]